MTEFCGFPDDALPYLSDLAANNQREWFHENKARYTAAIKQPAENFAAVMSDALAEQTGWTVKSKIFRMNRDLRFSKDKRPYNTHCHIAFFVESDCEVDPGWFFGFEPGKFSLGAGLFGMGKAQLQNFRQRVANEGASLQAHLAELVEQAWCVNDAELKNVPKPWQADHPQAALLRHKSLNVWQHQSDAQMIFQDQLLAHCLQSFQQARPVIQWLMHA